MWPSGTIWRHWTWSTLVHLGKGLDQSGNGAQPLPKPMLTYVRWRLLTFIWEQMEWREMREMSFIVMRLKITNLRTHLHLSWANELDKNRCGDSRCMAIFDNKYQPILRNTSPSVHIWVLSSKTLRIIWISVIHRWNVKYTWSSNESLWFKSSSRGQNGRHFTDYILRSNFLNEKFYSLIKFPLNFAAKRPIDNKSVLVWIMAWCRISDKPLSEPMLTWFTDAYIRFYGEMVW